MKNKLSINYLILFIAPFVFGCRGPIKEENKNNAPKSNLSMHVGNEKYILIDTKESVVTWKGDNVMGSNGHNGYVYLSQGELLIENGKLMGGTFEVNMNTIEDEKHKSKNGLIDHLKNPDFFDVVKFPFSTIVIKKTESTNEKDIKVKANLTIKGITNQVTFPAQMEIVDGILKANGKLTIDRTKWDIRYKSGKFYDNLADKAISDSIEFNVKIVAKQGKAGLMQTSLLKAEFSKEIETGTIYQSSSPYHNVVHQFTYLSAMQDFCTKTLLQMRTNSEVGRKIVKELEMELINAKAELNSSKFTGLKIESGLYEKFLKQINHRKYAKPLLFI